MWIVLRFATIWSLILWTCSGQVPSIPPVMDGGANSSAASDTPSSVPMGEVAGPTVEPTVPGPTWEPTISRAPTSPTPAPTRPTSGCWDNFTILYEDLAMQTPFSSNTYIICPNRTYNIGYEDGPASCCVNGDIPLVARSNTHFKCGEDGSSKNNCTFFGGSMHVLFNDVIFDEEITGAIVEGFTFVAPSRYTILGVAMGDITFRDCIFKDQINRGPVLAIFAPEGRRRRLSLSENSWERLQYVLKSEYMEEIMVNNNNRGGVDVYEEEEELEEEGVIRRNLQVANMMTMIFEACVFENCSQGDYQDGTPTMGVVTARTDLNTFVFNNCIFANNVYDGTTAYGDTGYAISVFDTDLFLNASCFINNDFAGFAPIEIFKNSEYELTENYLDDLCDTDVKCQFAAYADGQPSDPSNVTQCIDATQTNCQASIYADWLASHGLEAPSPVSGPVPCPSPTVPGTPSGSSTPAPGPTTIGSSTPAPQPTLSRPTFEPKPSTEKPTQTSAAAPAAAHTTCSLMFGSLLPSIVAIVGAFLWL